MKRFFLPIFLAGSAIGVSSVYAADGRVVYNKSCAACHSAMTPKLTGDKGLWEVRLKQGLDGLVASVVKGKGLMPPKGGDAKLSEVEIREAVEYMVSAIK